MIKNKNCPLKSVSEGKICSESVNESQVIQNSSSANDELDLYNLNILKQKYHSNPFICYLNINSLSNKIDDLKEICKMSPLEILCIDETKLDSSFPNSLFKIDGYIYPPYRRDRDRHGGGKMVFVKEGLITKRIENFETKLSETICLELTISNKKWFILFAYRPPQENNKFVFFNELNNTLSKAMNSYENILVIGDLNIDVSNPEKDTNNLLSDFIDTFSLFHLIDKKTCFKNVSGTTIDIMLTNRPHCFQKSATVVTGLSDFHRMVISCLKTTFKKIPPRKIIYRDYKNFDSFNFLHDLDQEMIKGHFYNACDSYKSFSDIFRNIADKHAPQKEKLIRGNNAPFMTKEVRKAIMTRSRLRKKYLDWPSRENYTIWKKQKNKCKKLCRKAKQNYFKKITEKDLNGNKKFWQFVKPFLTNKGILGSDYISIKKENNFIENEEELVEMFNSHYINIVENLTGIAPTINPLYDFPENDFYAVRNIIKQYENHPSIVEINKHVNITEKFEIKEATVPEINKLLKSINVKKATGPDSIPPKLAKLSANIADSHLCNVINKDINKFSYAGEAKVASVRPMYKKKCRNTIENYRPVSILNTFSKIYERYIHDSITPFIDKCLSEFIAAYRKSYSSSHVLIRLIENWKMELDNKKFVGAVLMDLSKAFDCIPHELLIAKMNAYGFSENTLTFFFSYLKRRKQNVRINNTYSVFQLLLSGVPQGSILGPILFNIFINDLFLFIKKAELHNFADDNTISSTSNNLNELISTLEFESNIATQWFRDNSMIVNPEKFQAIIIDRKNQKNNPQILTIDGKEINSTSLVSLLGLEIDSKLNFDSHISKLCKKSAGQLNALCRLGYLIGFEEKKILINSFIYANFNYCPLVWHFSSKKSINKIENIQKRALRFLLHDYSSNYETLLKKADRCTMEVKRLRTLALEIFKALNEKSPSFIRNYFEKNDSSISKKYDLKIPVRNTVAYGDKSLRCLAPRIWNSLPIDLKKENSYEKFKGEINKWFGPTCKCSLCSYMNNDK